MTDLSVIIPTLSEAEALPRLLAGFLRTAPREVIVADGGSRDGTADLARRWGATVVSGPRGRARQLNAGAAAARGEWLWFLHADAEVPSDWAHQLRGAMTEPRVVGGAFTTWIAAPGLRYRVLDAWGWVRPRLQRSFYGDQGIFVRRDVWTRLGGFADLPACEDVEFSERLRRAGRVVFLPGPLRTSARRWQQRGWWRTVAEHTRIAVRYARYGSYAVPPYPALAPGPAIHLVVMAKAPIPGHVKTRLTPRLSPDHAAALARALLQDTVERVRSVAGAAVIVAVEPADAVPDVQTWLPPVELMPQPPGDLGHRMAAVMADRFARGAPAVVVIGSDHPTLPADVLARTIAWLREGRDEVVVGPAEDGGYYLLGVTRPHPELFDGIPWSGPAVLQATLERAAARGLPVRRLPTWYDVDTPDDLARLQKDLTADPGVAPATARWRLESQRSTGPALSSPQR